MRWAERAARSNEQIRAVGRWRTVRTLDASGPTGKLDDGREVVSFASNDYLGLTQHPSVKEAARDALDRWGAGSGSARLIVGARPIHADLEEELAAWKSKERAVLFPSGYAANLGVLATFGTDGTVILSDELNHASIVDACRMSRAEVRVYPHNDLAALERLMPDAQTPAIVVTDSVFSMDGDVADIDGLMDICARHDALLVLDEAHAVFGPHPQPTADVDRIRVGTLSKFLGAAGGFVASDAVFADALINSARSFIFTTAGSPADAAAALGALRVLRSNEGDRLVARLRTLVDRIAPGHPSPIVPLVIGDEDAAVRASADLLEQGLLVPAIRPPSVPPGSSRLRITLSAAHSDEDLDRLLAALEKVGVNGV